MTVGIYALLFDTYDPFYIGQSINVEKRYKEHLYSLSKGNSNKKLLYAYENYGKPELIVLEECSVTSLDGREAYYISSLDAVNSGLNEWPGAVGVCRGSKHPNARYTDEQILAVIKLLTADTIIPFAEIKIKTGVSLSNIQNISSGRVGAHLKEIIPVEYSILEARKGNRMPSACSARGRGRVYPPIVSPSGEIYYNIDNVTKFADEHGLNMSHVCGVLNGIRKSHKGWRLK